MAAEASRQLVEQVEVRDEGELTSTETLPWQEDRPLWRLIVGNGYLHPLAIHLGPIYIERGEETAKLARELDESENWQGLLQYNLTCHYALIGETERAIERLGEALKLNPGLTEWSKEDPDLVSIREKPACLALYAESS